MIEPAQDRNSNHLHPLFREPLEAWLTATRAKGFRVLVYETFRTPQRQKYLYAIGRTIAPFGHYLTYTMDSCHRYGLAADQVPLAPNGKALWSGYDALYKAVPPAAFGLELLSFERPHLQLAGGQARARQLGIQRDVMVGSHHQAQRVRGLNPGLQAEELELPKAWQPKT
jgi:peptidoglycan LD-endopeptidase CwlK